MNLRPFSVKNVRVLFKIYIYMTVMHGYTGLFVIILSPTLDVQFIGPPTVSSQV